MSHHKKNEGPKPTDVDKDVDTSEDAEGQILMGGPKPPGALGGGPKPPGALGGGPKPPNKDDDTEGSGPLA